MVAVPVAAKPVPVAQVAQVTTEPAKPATVPAVKPEPAKPEAAKPAAVMKEPAKPAAAAPMIEKAEPKPEPAAAEAPPPKAAPIVPPRIIAGPVVPGPKYNDLVTAVIYRDAEAVKGLLALGKWADKPDSRGTTPLMIATTQGDGPDCGSAAQGGRQPQPPRTGRRHCAFHCARAQGRGDGRPAGTRRALTRKQVPPSRGRRTVT